MEKIKVTNTGDVQDEIVGTAHEVADRLSLDRGLSEDADTEPKKKPEIEPEKLPKEDPGTPEEEPDEDDDDDNPLLEPEIGDDPDKEKIKLPIM